MYSLHSFFLAIPAPGSGEDAWGRRFRLYGLMIAIGVIAALELTRRRWQARGGDPEDMSSLALWIVPAGLIGARLYHVITDHVTYAGHWFDNPFDDLSVSPFAIWKGGLGIPGGLLFGFLAGYIVARKRGLRIPPLADAVAPAVPLAQAIGRLGNYFNQELYGRPTDLPWGLNVDPAFRPAEYFMATTFQPTFLYEALWNLALMGVLIWLDRKRVLRPGRLFLLYIGGYFLGRLWVEALRSDEAKTIILGLRINIWISLLAMAAVAVTLSFIGLRRRPEDDDRPYVDGHTWDMERGIIPAGGVGGDPTADQPGTDQLVTDETGGDAADAGVSNVSEVSVESSSPPPEDFGSQLDAAMTGADQRETRGDDSKPEVDP